MPAFKKHTCYTTAIISGSCRELCGSSRCFSWHFLLRSKMPQ